MLKRRQYKILLLGAKVGAIAISTWLTALSIYGQVLGSPMGFLAWFSFFFFLLCQTASLILPITFLNGFLNKKILETETALKRKLRYLTAGFLLFSLYLGAAFLVAQWTVNRFQLKDPSPIVFIVLVLSLTFSPIHARLINLLDEKLYPERNRYKRLLKEMIKRMSGFIEEPQVLSNLSNWISDTMNITPIVALSIDKTGIRDAPFKLDSPRSVLAKIKDGSNFFWDEIPEDAQDTIDEEEKQWAMQKGISITVPMISQGEQVGMLSIGKKKNDEDFTGDDLEIFQEAAAYTAIALQNIKLQIEQLEKRRLDKELEVAREIQNRLVPQTLPEVKGLEVHGYYQPCFEVGGDYFDVIPVSEGKIALIVADVSGKGAGAALLMSNLQASLRMTVYLPLSFKDIIYRVNNLIYENSLPSQFITFFIGLWDGRNSTFEYINAGHNPPYIIGKSDQIKRLPPTGIGLGIKKDQHHNVEAVTLEKDDVLVIYTDGIEEFFNADTEAFGLDRMIACTRENRHLTPLEMNETLFRRLDEFYGEGDASYSDDLTIITAKRTD